MPQNYLPAFFICVTFVTFDSFLLLFFTKSIINNYRLYSKKNTRLTQIIQTINEMFLK
jgi:hypothetical protein